MFWRVHQSNYNQKKDTVVWPLVGMFGGSMSLDCFGGFLNQIMTGKKVQSSGHRLQCLEGSMNSDCFGGFLDQITTGKNRYRQPADWNGIIN